MVDFKELSTIKSEVSDRKAKLKEEFIAKNESIQNLQKKKDDLYIKYGLKSPDLKTSSGLYQVAVENGLQDKANKVIRDNSGEEYKKIYSGGFISDIFDTLNMVSYGTVGVLKGKGFVEGIKNRESFADSDALGQYGLVGAIGGIALDIATDPLTYIAPWTVAKKIPGISKTVKFGKEAIFGKQVTEKFIEEGAEKIVSKIEGGTELGKRVGQGLVFMFGADNIFKDTWRKMTRNIGVETVATKDLMKVISKMDKELSTSLSDTIFTVKTIEKNGNVRTSLIRKPLSEIQRELSQPQFEKVKEVYDKIEDLGKKLVDEGVLSADKQGENVNEYIHQYYLKYIEAQGKPFSGGVPGIKGTKKRVDILSESTEASRIENPGYVLGRTLLEMTKDLENAKLFNKVNELYAVGKELPGYTKLPEVTRLGSLSGKYVPDYISKYLVSDMIVPTEKSMADRVMGEFKFMKVILSPAAMVRNGISNLTLNYWKLGLLPGDKAYFKAAQALKEGDLNKYVKLAKPLGYRADSMAANELYTLLDGTEGKGVSKVMNNIKEKFADFYQGEESYAKMAAFIKQVDKGVSPEEAWKMAESATFNYAEVTPFIRKMRTAWYGLPFITFPLKATPLAVETALKTPGRISVIGKIRNAIEEQSDYEETMREKASEPQWVKDGFFVKLPIKDEQGRSAYFDLTYILPFGDLISGQLFERSVSRETGVKESVGEAALSKNPIFNFLKEISRNQDFSGNKIWKDTDSAEKQLLELNRHLMKSFLPPTISDQIPGGYNSKNERVEQGLYAALTPEEQANQKRTLTQELLKYVGMKTQPVDDEIQEQMNEWQKKKGLSTLLQEENIIKDFTSSYIPK